MATLGATSSTTEFPTGGSADLVVTALPGVMSISSGASFVRDTSGTVPTPEIRLPDGTTEFAVVAVKVPAGATSISSIKVFHRRTNTGNLRLLFYTAIWDFDTSGSAKTEDITDTLATYAGGAADSTLGIITVPSAAYNALTIEAGDLFVLDIERYGGDGSDTHTEYFAILGAEITFA